MLLQVTSWRDGKSWRSLRLAPSAVLGMGRTYKKKSQTRAKNNNRGCRRRSRRGWGGGLSFWGRRRLIPQVPLRREATRDSRAHPPLSLPTVVQDSGRCRASGGKRGAKVQRPSRRSAETSGAPSLSSPTARLQSVGLPRYDFFEIIAKDHDTTTLVGIDYRGHVNCRVCYGVCAFLIDYFQHK